MRFIYLLVLFTGLLMMISRAFAGCEQLSVDTSQGVEYHSDIPRVVV